MEEAEGRLAELEGRNAQEEMGESPMSQVSGFDESEAEWASLPEFDGEDWPSGAEWAPLPDDESDEPETSGAPVEAGHQKPEESLRELVL